jgi:hypothetical protein
MEVPGPMNVQTNRDRLISRGNMSLDRVFHRNNTSKELQGGGS